MNNSATVASMIEEAIMKKEGGKDRFNMIGQYTSPVMYDEETGREYVIYESPNGEEVKVFGNWNEYVVSVDEDGNDLIGDTDFPVMMNKDGEYVLDEKGLEEKKDSRPQGDQGMIEEADSLRDTEEEGMAEEMESEEEQAMGGGMPMAMGGMDMRKKLMMALGGKIYAGGGKMYAEGGGVGDGADPEILRNTIRAKERQIQEIRSSGRPDYRKADLIEPIMKDIESLKKELAGIRSQRLQTRRQSEAERGTVSFANGGFIKPIKRY